MNHSPLQEALVYIGIQVEHRFSGIILNLGEEVLSPYFKPAAAERLVHRVATIVKRQARSRTVFV